MSTIVGTGIDADPDRGGVLSVSLDSAELQRLLPHAWPFLMLDTVSGLEPGRRAEAVKCVTNAEWAVQGHFPGNPIFPGVLLIEAAAQLCGVVIGSQDTGGAPAIGYLVSVKRFRLRSVVRPGDQVRLVAQIENQRGALSEFRVTARVGAQTCAEGIVTIRVG